MINAITHSSIFVLDQDQALDFYVGKLGLEVADDVDMGFMRWLTVKVPGDDRQILLETPSNPMLPEDHSEAITDLLTKGALGLGFILTTDDCRGDYERLKAEGVEFMDEPTDRFYGIDCGLRDPFGNQLRMTQVHAVPREPDPASFA